jgi:hypothetical protein
VESKADTSLFVYHRGSETAYMLLYVDDIVLTTIQHTASSGLNLSQRQFMIDILDRADS